MASAGRSPPPSSAAVELAAPSAALLPVYVATLRAGWSPSTSRDISGEHLADIAADAAGFIANLAREDGGTLRDAHGKLVGRLPGCIRWIVAPDGTFLGAINLRFCPGTSDLPEDVSGHIGYAVVPAQRNRGVARAALRAMLPLARARGLSRVKLTCDTDNVASRRVIEACGGISAGEAVFHGVSKVEFWIDT